MRIVVRIFSVVGGMLLLILAAPAQSIGLVSDAPKLASESNAGRAEPGPALAKRLESDKELPLGPEAMRAFNESQNGPVAFYGLVVDQDTNLLQNVRIDISVTEHYEAPFFTNSSGKTTRLQRQTGPDGRFEVSGLKGRFVTIRNFQKEGYEPEFIRRSHGDYGARSGSLENPAVFTLWSTNRQEALIGGDRSFVVIPDGRRYAIDLLNGTITEGEEGDLIAWIKRPEPVSRGQRYDWSCALTVPNGGLSESQSVLMFTAPEAGYTNAFAYREEGGVNGWGGSTGDKRFYVRFRNGKMYGRMTINLYADYHGKQPAMITLSYAVNPAGSRLLR